MVEYLSGNRIQGVLGTVAQYGQDTGTHNKAQGNTYMIYANVIGSNNTVVGVATNAIKVYMDINQSGTGTIYAGVWNAGNTGDTPDFTYGTVETGDLASYGGANNNPIPAITFTSDSSYTVQAGDRIGIKLKNSRLRVNETTSFSPNWELAEYISGWIVYSSVSLMMVLTAAGYSPNEKATLVTAAVPAITGWTGASGGSIPSGWTLTSGTGVTLDTTAHDRMVYDLGTSGQMTPNDEWVCDYDITRNSGDYHDHPMLMIKSTDSTYGDASVNGQNQINLQYWGNGNTSDSAGDNGTYIHFRAGGTNYSANAASGNQTFSQNVGEKLYYRTYMSKAGDGDRVVRRTAWTSDAYRTAEGSTGIANSGVANHYSPAGMNSGWDSSDPLRYFIIFNKNGNQANWTISNWKFWNGTASTGVANNMLSTTPTVEFTFTDVPDSSNLPAGTRYEETDTRKIFRLKDGGWVVKGTA